MFTGIIEETGKIILVKRGRNSSRLMIQGKVIFEDVKEGDSVAVNGVCLTVSGFENQVFSADVMSETLSRSALGSLKAGDRVNLERAMPAYGRFGGHIVSGHIDGTGSVASIRKDDNAIWFSIRTTEKILRYIVEKGSVAIDGISLTVATVQEDMFKVSIIPHTAKVTTLADKNVGDTVNLENDIVGKYIEKLLAAPQAAQKPQSNITAEFLMKNGF